MPDDGTVEEVAGAATAVEASGRDPGTTLITGCSSGIGRATALTFLEDDWTVFATARDPEDIADLKEAGCLTAQLDVTDEDEIKRVVNRVVAQDGRIDCLINNAGYGQLGPVEEVPTTAVHEQFAVNLYGPHRLIRAVLPTMRQQEHGRIVNVSSAAGRLANPGLGVYSASKFALEGLSDSLRAEVAEHGVEVVLVEPGPVDTEFVDRADSQLDLLDRSGAYEWFYDLMEDTRLIGGGGPGAVSPQRVADVIHQAGTCSSPRPRYPVGTGARLTMLARFVPAQYRDRCFQLLRKLFV
jgi:NAD(P)-dependent dehydrogenase (short-subunit alcohol dehydrogenase family)